MLQDIRPDMLTVLIVLLVSSCISDEDDIRTRPQHESETPTPGDQRGNIPGSSEQTPPTDPPQINDSTSDPTLCQGHSDHKRARLLQKTPMHVQSTQQQKWNQPHDSLKTKILSAWNNMWQGMKFACILSWPH